MMKTAVMPRRPERHTGGFITSTFLRGRRRVKANNLSLCLPWAKRDDFLHKDIHLLHAIETIYSRQYILRLYFMSCIRLLCKCCLAYDVLLFPVRL